MSRKHAPIGEVEPALEEKAAARRRRLDAKAETDRRSVEVTRTDSPAKLERAAKRLKAKDADQRILAVPHWRMELAVEAMKRAGVSGVVTNLCGSERIKVDVKGR